MPAQLPAVQPTDRVRDLVHLAAGPHGRGQNCRRHGRTRPPHTGGGQPGTYTKNNVADLDPQDPYVFGPPGSGSGSISTRHGSGSFYDEAKKVKKP